MVIKNLVMVTVFSITLSACAAGQMEKFENKSPKQKEQLQQQERTVHSKIDRTRDIIENDNNARKLDATMESFEKVKIFESKKSRHEQREEEFLRKMNRTKDIIDNSAKKQDASNRSIPNSFPPYNKPFAF